MFTVERYRMPSGLESMDEASSVVQIIPTSLREDGLPHKTSSPATLSWRQARPCAFCGEMFTPSHVGLRNKRFCGRSCAAKSHAKRPEHLHTPEVRRKISASKR